MNTKDQNSLYLISYLVSKAENERIVGLSTIATRLYYLKRNVERHRHYENLFQEDFSDFIVKNDDNSLDWSKLREFMYKIKDSNDAQMFIEVETESIGAEGSNKWTYEFRSQAPHSILESQLESIVDKHSRFIRMIEEAAQIDENELFQEVYQQ